MKKALLITLVVLLGVAALTAVGVGVAFAQTATPESGFTMPMLGGRGGHGGHGGMGGFPGGRGSIDNTAALQAYADAFGMTVEELQAQLDAGESIWSIAAAKGMTVAEFEALNTAARAAVKMDNPMHAAALPVYAKAFGMTEAELQAQLDAGETPWSIAADKGMTLTAFSELQTAARKAGLDAAVAAGTITQAQADLMLERMSQNPMGGKGMFGGHGIMFGGQGGRHGGGFGGDCPMQPSATATPAP
ncbi:MAG: hypothetical protein OHK0052_00280 [Anaerolineales bacterium]